MKTKVGKSKYGRGVFATQNFRKGQLVDSCEVIVLATPKKGETLSSYV